ncbi:MAG: glycosyltransferase family 2 protein, partial [Fimbriimonadaceae bacterium]
MPDFDLSITVVNWNVRDDLRACLQSLRQLEGEGSFEVIVVDNASADGSAEMVREEFPEVTLYALDQNLGFAAGHNYALDRRNGFHAALINPDTVAHPGLVRSVLGYFHEHPEVGIIGPKVLNPDGSLQYSCRRFPNPVAAAFRNTILGRLFPNNRFTREYLMTDWEHETERPVDWVSGCALFVRGEVLDAIGGLDADYYMYCEETDFCLRAHKAGYQVMYVPSGQITHAIGKSTDKVANKMIVRFHRSMLRYYRKNILPEQPVLARPFLYVFAAGALSLRASLFLLKNFKDWIVRSVRG